MMKERIFAGHPSLALPSLHLALLAFASLALAPLALVNWAWRRFWPRGPASLETLHAWESFAFAFALVLEALRAWSLEAWRPFKP